MLDALGLDGGLSLVDAGLDLEGSISIGIGGIVESPQALCDGVTVAAAGLMGVGGRERTA